MGKSDRARESEFLYDQIGGINSYVPNRFDEDNDYGTVIGNVAGYNIIRDPRRRKVNPFKWESSTKDILDALNKSYDAQISNIYQNIGQNVASARSALGKSLRSRGISSGSMFDEIVNSAGDNAMTSGADIIKNLRAAKLAVIPRILQQGNQNKLLLTRLAQEYDLQNYNNLLNKLKLQLGAMEGLDDTTAFDDILAIATTASNFIKPIKLGKD